MQDKEIIYDKLKFLVEQYNMNFKHTTNGKEHYYRFLNSNGCFVYYEWPQFEDFNFSIIINGINKREINMFEEYPKIITAYNKNHRGIKCFFKDKRNDYWEMIASIIKLEIENKGSLFGLKVFKK